MEKLQNNFTTPEQSKRLLELGVPVRSTDCYYPIINAQIIDYIEVICGKEVFFDNYIYLKDFFPCWSVGRLIEIYNTCVDFDLDNGAAIAIFIQEESPIVQMMEMFEDKVGIMDFLKLEE